MEEKIKAKQLLSVWNFRYLAAPQSSAVLLCYFVCLSLFFGAE
jgi:uncharacterized protein YebE (UPF0316 family)